MIEIKKLKDWKAPKDWTEILTIDTHTCGEPLRIIISGFPKLKGKTLLEKRTHAKNKFDQLRKAIMWEPRGHADMYGAIIISPDTPSADFGVIFIHDIRGLYFLIATSAFMSLMFPTIYGIALNGLGDDAALGSSGLVMAIVGGALMPPIQGWIIDRGPLGGLDAVNVSFVLPLICFLCYCNLWLSNFKYS